MSRTAAWRILPAVAAVMLVSVLVVQASVAAFSSTTSTAGSWDSATVTLSNDGGATFATASGMVPGDTNQACVTVTYDGDVATAGVKLYGSTLEATPNDLGEYLDLTIEEVDIGVDTCAAATSTATIFSGATLSVNAGSFAATHTNWSDGLASNWTPTANGETQDYRITVTLQDNNDAQGLLSTATFNWETQNS